MTPSNRARAALARDLARTFVSLHEVSQPSYGLAEHVVGLVAIVLAGVVGILPWIVLGLMWWNDL